MIAIFFVVRTLVVVALIHVLPGGDEGEVIETYIVGDTQDDAD